MTSPLSIGQCASLACLLEVAAPKPGNVHRGADFADMGLEDFLVSAVAIGPSMERAAGQPLGRTVLAAVQATRRLTNANTNLGIVLLLAPLASVPRSQPISVGIGQVLAKLTSQDADDVYQAIRLANPGGLTPHGHDVQRADVAAPPPANLLEAMQLAAEWDLIAAQYANGFQQVLHTVVPWLTDDTDRAPLSDRIVAAHVRLMAAYPDTLIARKLGPRVAQEAAARAQAVLEAGPRGSADYLDALADLDFWLRSDENRRNPGTTADLVAAALFVALREDGLATPYS